MRIVKDPKLKKHSMTFSIPLYIEEWITKMKEESPGFDVNKFLIDRFNEYMEKRGDYEKTTIE